MTTVADTTLSYTKVQFTVKKEASWASEVGPSVGITAVTAERLANSLGLDYVQGLSASASACSGPSTNECSRCAAGPLTYCDDLGQPNGDQVDYEVTAVAQSPKLLGDFSTLANAVAALQAKSQESYSMKTALLGYEVQHLGCPGSGCFTAASLDCSVEICPPNWQGDYEITFKIVQAEPVTPPFFMCANLQQLEIQDNQFGGELSSVYPNLDYASIALNGGLPRR